MNIDDLLKDKEATHGLFDDTATIAQTLKAVMRRGRDWENLPPASKEALELIATKAARILNGDATDRRALERHRRLCAAQSERVRSGVSPAGRRRRS